MIKWHRNGLSTRARVTCTYKTPTHVPQAILTEGIVLSLVFENYSNVSYVHGVVDDFCHPCNFRASLLFIRNINLWVSFSVENIWSLFLALKSRSRRSVSNSWRRIMKCISSSISRHIRHNRLSNGVIGLVCRPCSISKLWQLVRNLANAVQ